MWRYLVILVLLVPAALLHAAQQSDLEEQTRQIAAELRCPVCQNLSAADSPSELAQQMRALILQQLKEGKSSDQIKAYFVSKYGEWVLLAPTAKGFSLLLWVLPYVAAVAGIALVLFLVRRSSRKKDHARPSAINSSLIERVKREAAADTRLPVDLEAEGARAPLLQEQARLYADLRELEFDYQAGKLSQDDYQDLRHKLETEAALVLQKLGATPRGRPAAAPKAAGRREGSAGKKPDGTQSGPRLTWRLVAGAAFLLLFGITLGVLLNKSLRSRGSEQDSITGDFLTGTGSGGIGASSNISSFLTQGRTAFERQEWPKAIEAFKNVLALDASHPEAHAYMGLILAQAGHADGALLAFDRALSADPNFPLALWGKGMLLYKDKEDLPGARETLQSLLKVMPQGAEKNQVQKTITEITELNSRQKQGPKKTESTLTPSQAQQIRGTISVDPKLRSKLDSQSVLFIVVYAAGSTGGPPLAVKKIDHPSFPLAYSLGPENVMMQGKGFSGKVLVSARLDRDGNAMTREAGNLMGEFRKNPVAVGSHNVDIVIDRVM